LENRYVLQALLSNYADHFRDQADRDYISARLNYFVRSRQQFLWAGQQAIEKYLKAILLYNGKSSMQPMAKLGNTKNTFGHDLTRLHKEVTTLTLLGYKLSQDQLHFLKYLDDLGAPDGRYQTIAAHSDGEFIFKLDELVWHIRRYCQFFPNRSLQGEDPIPGFQELQIEAVKNPKYDEDPMSFSIQNGELEEILKLPAGDESHEALVRINKYFGTGPRPPEPFQGFSNFTVPIHYLEWWDKQYHDMVSNYVKLPAYKEPT